MICNLYVVLALSVSFANVGNGYKPVIIVHGLFDSASSMNELVEFINQTHPRTSILNVDMYDSLESLTPLTRQLEKIKKDIRNFMQSSKEGVHLIGFSQGGLIARGIVQTMDDHNVQNFISLSAPLNGQYGDTSVLNRILPGYLKADVYKLFYTTSGQIFSIANYWKDPHHTKDYETYSAYLAPLNNESTSYKEFSLSWRTNMARLKNLVAIGGPDDAVITPWQSAHFQCYDSNENIVNLRNLKIYTSDVFGLKTLDKAKRLHRISVPNVAHLGWHTDKNVFLKYIEPWLT